MDLKYIYIIISDVRFFSFVETYLGTYTLLYVYWSLHTNLSLPRNYLPSLFTPFQSLPRHYYHIPLKSYMHTYFPLACKPLIFGNPFDHRDQPSPHILDIIHDHHLPLLHLQPHTHFLFYHTILETSW